MAMRLSTVSYMYITSGTALSKVRAIYLKTFFTNVEGMAVPKTTETRCIGMADY